MTNTLSPVPPGFCLLLRSSPVLEALGGFLSRGDGDALEIGLLVGPTHLNARGRLHGGVSATLLDVAMGYMLSARTVVRRCPRARVLCWTARRSPPELVPKTRPDPRIPVPFFKDTDTTSQRSLRAERRSPPGIALWP